MKWYMDLKIGTKLISAFLVVAFIGAFIGYQGITSLKEADESDTILYERNLVPVNQIGDISAAFQRMRCNLVEIPLAANESEKKDLETRIADRSEEIGKLIAELEKNISSDDVRKAFDNYMSARKEFLPVIDEYLELISANKRNEALALLKGPMEKRGRITRQRLINGRNCWWPVQRTAQKIIRKMRTLPRPLC